MWFEVESQDFGIHIVRIVLFRRIYSKDPTVGASFADAVKP